MMMMMMTYTDRKLCVQMFSFCSGKGIYCPLMVILQAMVFIMVLYLYKYFIFFIKICMLCCCFFVCFFYDGVRTLLHSENF